MHSRSADLDQAGGPPARVLIQDPRRLQHDGQSVRRRKEKGRHHVLRRYALGL